MERDEYGGGRGRDERDPGAARRWAAGGGFAGNVSGYGRGGSGPGEYGYAGGMARGPNTEWGGGYAGGYGRQGGYGNRSADQWGRQRFAGRGPRGYRRSDVRINEEICEALTRHPDIDATDIEVRVQNGDVTLAGAVDDKYAKRLAEDIAEACSGVTDVRNELRVGRAGVVVP
jgi:osmotically-inducible protein OsmY